MMSVFPVVVVNSHFPWVIFRPEVSHVIFVAFLGKAAVKRGYWVFVGSDSGH